MEILDDKLLLDGKSQTLIRNFMPSHSQLVTLADFFSVLSDETRVKILSALSISDMCVSDISLMLSINQTTVSHQLKTLRLAGLVDYRKQGKISFYTLKDKRVLDIMLIASEKAL